jgi:hypothetical protein
VEPVSLGNAVRDIMGNVFIDLTDKVEKDDYGSNAVGVIIPIDDDLFLLVNGTNEAVSRFLHVLHQKGIMEIAEGRGKEPSGCVNVYYFPAHEDTRYDRAETEFMN